MATEVTERAPPTPPSPFHWLASLRGPLVFPPNDDGRREFSPTAGKTGVARHGQLYGFRALIASRKCHAFSIAVRYVTICSAKVGNRGENPGGISYYSPIALRLIGVVSSAAEALELLKGPGLDGSLSWTPESVTATSDTRLVWLWASDERTVERTSVSRA